MSPVSAKSLIKEMVEKNVYMTKEMRRIYSATQKIDSPWMFDFRKVILKPSFLEAYVELFFERYSHLYPFQVGGLETAAIPLISAIVMKSNQMGMPVNGFFIRKTRNKTGTLNTIEGTMENQKVILVDDLINSGKSFVKQIEILEALAREDEKLQDLGVISIFPILQFRDTSHYPYFSEKKIRIESIFLLNDFTESLGIRNIETPQVDKYAPNHFEKVWYWKAPDASFERVLPKSGPVFHEGKIYVGSDTGVFYCLDARSGEEVWTYLVPFGKQKRIRFSTPVIFRDMVIFGSYDGNIYCLDALTGERRWMFFDADWIESTPCVAEDSGLIFITLEFGLFRKRGALVAIDAHTGSRVWLHHLEHSLRSSPALSPSQDLVYCGDELGSMHAFSAQTGELIWKTETRGVAIVSAPRIDTNGVLIAWSGLSTNHHEERGTCTVADSKTGRILFQFSDFFFGSYSPPLFVRGKIIFTALDKHIYAIDIHSGMLSWKKDLGARIFSSPSLIIHDGVEHIYIGSNSGAFHEMDIDTGTITSTTILSERIMNGVAHDAQHGTFFLPTHANEIYALRRT